MAKMTNAEKYLKDGVNVEEFAKVIESYYYNSPFESELEAVESFLKAPVQPTLTEDEKVILRNIQVPFKWIRRTSSGELLISDTKELEEAIWIVRFSCYPHLFQFIKEGEEYPIAELLKGE